MWTIQNELNFFNDAIKLASIEQLMVRVEGQYYAFKPKNINRKVTTPQARNGLIGHRTEKWCKEFFEATARKHNLYAVNGVVCEEIGLTRHSPADLAFCTSDDQFQRAENIKLLFEIKMGIVNNYSYDGEAFEFCGDFNSHTGCPSLLRSDSMLKAIGKAVNIRVDSRMGKKIPIIIAGNSPISEGYMEKVDCLCKSGIIQKFISLYPNPTNQPFVSQSPDRGFETYDSLQQIEGYISQLLVDEMNYFSSSKSNKELGKLISIANMETTEEMKGQKFIELLEL